MQTKVEDLMTRKVFTLEAEKRLFIAQQIMDWAHIRHVPVVDGQRRVVGLVSHRDVLRASISIVSSKVAKAEGQQHLTGIPVRDVMRAPVQTVAPDLSVQEAAKLMRRGRIGCLPVVNAQQELIGIITESDLLKIVEELP
ncbi:MAG: CBS domain-containing protein [Terriglobales bacterium]